MNNFKLKESIDCYDDLIPHLGKILRNVDNKNFLELKRVIMPLRAEKDRKNFDKKIYEEKFNLRRNDFKMSLFQEIKAKKVDLSKYAKSNRRMKR